MGKKKWFSLMGLSIIFPGVLVACGVKASNVQDPGEGSNWQDDARNKIGTPSTPKNPGNGAFNANQVSASFPWPKREDQGYEKVWNWVRNLDKIIDLESPGLRNNPEAFKAALLAKYYEAKTLLGDIEYIKKNWDSIKNSNNNSLSKKTIDYQEKLKKDPSYKKVIDYAIRPNRLFNNVFNVKNNNFEESMDSLALNLNLPIILLSLNQELTIRYLNAWIDLQIAFLTLIDENDIEKSFDDNKTKFSKIMDKIEDASELTLSPQQYLSIDEEKVFLQDLNVGNDINDKDIYKKIIEDWNNVLFLMEFKLWEFYGHDKPLLKNNFAFAEWEKEVIEKYFYPKITPIKLKENWTQAEIEASWKQFLNDGKNKFYFWPNAEIK
ncbi:hypothetical protein ACW95P_04760 [Candidatus Mycoplasma pogonae]